jgi:hypothetical protein
MRAKSCSKKFDNSPCASTGYKSERASSRSLFFDQNPRHCASGKEESFYLVTISLPKKLLTFFRKEIPFTPEMTAQARVITKDQSLLGRLLSNAAKLQK